MDIVLYLVLAALCIAVLIVLLRVERRTRREQETERTMEELLRSELEKSREDGERNARSMREELLTTFTNFTTLIEGKLNNIQHSSQESATQNRDELAKSLETMRRTVEEKLTAIQNDNSVKLEMMRQTVDEKLHQTLEQRLGQSFKLVSERLEQVQKGLGEMQSLANGVGDLKKVLSNVKTKGVLGEVQLDAILEQMLTNSQYERNVKTKKGSNDVVEFAIKIPSKEYAEKFLWLPIDAKFPTEDYERLMAAYEQGDVAEIERSKKELERTVRLFAKDISTKYIDPPNTTDFAIMFLPFEGLYAEVLRIIGLFESVQREYKITITGPTTISAFLSSLQMGFRSLAVEKRTSEIWDLLGAVRTEFGKFGAVLEKTKDKLDQASKELDNASVRSRAIERKLRSVQSLPEEQASQLLDDVNHIE